MNFRKQMYRKKFQKKNHYFMKNTKGNDRFAITDSNVMKNISLIMWKCNWFSKAKE